MASERKALRAQVSCQTLEPLIDHAHHGRGLKDRPRRHAPLRMKTVALQHHQNSLCERKPAPLEVPIMVRRFCHDVKCACCHKRVTGPGRSEASRSAGSTTGSAVRWRWVIAGSTMRITDKSGEREIEIGNGTNWTSEGSACHEVVSIGKRPASSSLWRRSTEGAHYGVPVPSMLR